MSTSTMVMLSPETHRQWKDDIMTAALDLAAYNLLDGSEQRPTAANNAEERKAIADWDKAQSKIAGAILKTLDSAHKALIIGIPVKDARAVWNKLNSHYETKDAATRFYATQNMMSVQFRDEEHKDEHYFGFGSRVVEAANKWKDLLEADIPVVTQGVATAVCTDTGTHVVRITQGTATANPGPHSQGSLIDEIAISIIVIQLGLHDDAKMVRQSVLGGPRTIEKTLEALKTADQLAKSETLGATGSALAAIKRTARPPTENKGKQFYCKIHGKNVSHNSDKCKRLLANAGNAVNVEGAQSAMAAGVAHLASPPTIRDASQKSDTYWNADSGATSHMTSNKQWLRNLRPCQIPIRLADNKIVYATGKGMMVFNPVGNMRSIVMPNVLYVPDLKNNLFSIVSSVLDSKLRVEIEGTDLVFKKDDETILTGSIKGKIAMLDGQTLPQNEQAFIAGVTKEVLHQRLAHISQGRLDRMISRNLVTGITVNKSDWKDVCEHCIAGKQHRDPFPSLSENRATENLHRIHTDVHGALPSTISGFKYWIVLVDDASRNKTAVPMKKKSDAADVMKQYVITAENQTGKRVKIIRDDKGGEYMGKELQRFLDAKGIIRECTVVATPSQNGVAERLNRTLAEGIVAMLNQANLPQSWWAQALLYLVKIQNVVPSSALSDTTSYEVFNGKKPDLTLFRTFGCRMYVNILRKDRKNLQSHTRQCIFIGFEEGFKGWKFYEPSTKKSGVTRDAIFDETSFLGLSTKTAPVAHDKSTITVFWPDEGDENLEVQSPAPPPPPPPPAAQTTPTAPYPTPPSSSATQVPPTVPVVVPTPLPAAPTLPTITVSAPTITHTAFPPLQPTASTSTRKGKAKEAVPFPASSPSPTKETFATKAKRAVPSKPAPPPPSSRPLRAAAEKVKDYFAEGRRTTEPAPRRTAEASDSGGEFQVVGRGGDKKKTSENPSPERPTPGALPDLPESEDEIDLSLQADEEEFVDLDEALRETPIIDSLDFVYGTGNDILTIAEAHQIGMEIVIEKALSAATRPGDSPRSWTEAMKRDDADEWLKAAEKEVDALQKNGTWDLVQLPPNRKAIGSRWVFLIKRKSDGTIERYKGRLVAKGYAQAPGVDFDQVFAPTARLAALRAILAQAALSREHIESIDISNAYLNGELETEYEVYMQQPEGFTQEDPNGGKWVCRLKKGLYRLKQAGRLWYQKLGETLEAIGFKQINADPSVYIWIRDGVRVILPVFVDDVTISSKSKERIQWTKDEIAKHFKIRDLGPTTYLLGMKVEYDQENHRLQLSQEQYIKDILNRFNMSDCSGVATPMDPGNKLTKDQSPKTKDQETEMSKVPYINAVGALMYLAVATRPDISYTVAKLAQFNSCPGMDHWKAVKHLLRYLQSTIHLKLTYQPVDNDNQVSTEIFRAYSDADHAGCLDTRRSTTGYFLKMGTGAISWSSKKQTSVAISSTEAEYIAASAAGMEVVWMRGLLKELGFKMPGPSLLIMDNQSAIAVVKNPEHHGRMKHVDIRHHWIRLEAKKGTLKPIFVPTEQMTADILTKPLPRQWVEEHRLGLGLM